MEVDDFEFKDQFITLQDKMSPLILEVLDDEDIGDLPALFFFASLIKDTLNQMNDKEVKEVILRFMFDE